MSIASGFGSVLGTSSGIQNLAHSLAARLGGSAGTYFQQLNAASFRNVSFVSLGGMSNFGRRVDIHEYPYRDTPWAEDLGRATRHFAVSGYLVGDDVIAQRDLLIAACEQSGVGKLVHATYGELNVTLFQFRVIERWDKGRYFEIEFEFVESGERVFPSTITATTTGLIEAALGADAAASLDFVSNALTTLSAGAATLQTYVVSALGLVHSCEERRRRCAQSVSAADQPAGRLRALCRRVGCPGVQHDRRGFQLTKHGEFADGPGGRKSCGSR
ncbi:DNA circularization N-terminal domain-containing protein [Caballeronia sp. LZ033]|uniref:DNA circularization N-terminal domain-containing protein n=1 Tax=Caballeronia sp. LZ033 TaxID=3038566 RepID=UPI00286070CD|nr:DNA circularization N-terminal domain-containing protein [Caballeronia sp. LZ033]MDR5813314.1 DNA circularization N-terminal domain-containing protein [Caballeronia sp. LZ033]